MLNLCCAKGKIKYRQKERLWRTHAEFLPNNVKVVAKQRGHGDIFRPQARYLNNVIDSLCSFVCNVHESAGGRRRVNIIMILCKSLSHMVDAECNCEKEMHCTQENYD